MFWCSSARAQSSGSFPEPAPPPVAPRVTPPAPLPPAPVYSTPPATPPAPVPAVIAPPPAPAAPYAPALPPYQPLTARSGLENLPPILPYAKGLPVPPGYRVVNRPATGLTVGGALTFAAAYLAGMGLAASQKFENGTAYAAIPVIGPWAAIGGRSFSCKVPITANATGAAVQRALNACVGQAFDEVTTVVFLTADGLIQATGAVLFFIGLASGHKELVRKDLPKTAVTVLPGGGFAVSVAGAF
jgi:hypothetical protein